MELSTRCPECETIFPVSLEQLQLRKGYIRCVHCAHIFDGFEEAVPAEGPRSATAPNSAPAQPFSIGATTTPPAARESSREHSIPAAAPVVADSIQNEPRIPAVVRRRSDLRKSAVPGGPSFTISERGWRAEAERDDPQVPVHGPVSEPGFTAETVDEALHGAETDNDDYLYIEPRNTRRSARHQPDFMTDTRHGYGWMTPVWLILTIFGLVLLAAQGVYVYRAQLANSFPNLRPMLETACERLGCKVPYERRIEAIAITGSALRASGPPQDEVSQLVLEVILRNTYERPQEWPTLVLDLKDASGAVVVRRNMGPEIWVPEPLREGPFAANSEVKVQVPVAVKGLQANGFQLDKFFP